MSRRGEWTGYWVRYLGPELARKLAKKYPNLDERVKAARKIRAQDYKSQMRHIDARQRGQEALF